MVRILIHYAIRCLFLIPVPFLMFFSHADVLLLRLAEQSVLQAKATGNGGLLGTGLAELLCRGMHSMERSESFWNSFLSKLKHSCS